MPITKCVAGAPARSEAGHRLYGRAHVERVYRIVALRRLGLPLEAIRGLLDGGDDLAAAVRAQLAELEGEVECVGALRDRVAEQLDRGVDPSDGDLIDLTRGR